MEHPDKEPRTLILEPAADIPLCRSPRYNPADNTRSCYGTDLLLHKTGDGRIFFYLRHWSSCEGGTNTCQLITASVAKHFIREQLKNPRTVPGLKHEHLMKYLPGLYWYREEDQGA